MEHTGFVMHLGFIAGQNLPHMHIRLWDGEGCKEKAVSLMGGTVFKICEWIYKENIEKGPAVC